VLRRKARGGKMSRNGELAKTALNVVLEREGPEPWAGNFDL